jgi:hypothetical protein
VQVVASADSAASLFSIIAVRKAMTSMMSLAVVAASWTTTERVSSLIWQPPRWAQSQPLR